MLLRLQSFSFENHYRKGNDIIFTDHISHNIPLINGPERRETAPGLDLISIASINEELNVSQIFIDRIRSATQCDLNMQALLAVIVEGWPKDKSKINSFLQEFWTFRDGLSMLDCVILKGTYVVMSQTLHKEVVTLIHEHHMQITKCRLWACSCVF